MLCVLPTMRGWLEVAGLCPAPSQCLVEIGGQHIWKHPFEIRPDRFGLRRTKNGINVLPLNIPFSVLKSINQVTSLKVFSGNQSYKYSKTTGHDSFEILPETSLLGPPDTFICFSTRSPGKEFKRSVCKNYTSEYSSGTDVCSRRQEEVAIVAYWYRTVLSIVTLLAPHCVVNSDNINYLPAD